MKMLKDFPLVFKAFKLIEDDSAGVMARKVERNAVVPDTWVERFKLAEAGLKRVSAKRVRDTRLTDKQLHAFELDTCDGESNRSAFSHVAVPCNTWDKKILKAEKASPQQIKAVSKVLNEFFDGELNDFAQMASAPDCIYCSTKTQKEEEPNMKWGTFIAVDRKNRRVKGANREQLVMEEYMHVAGIKDSKDVLGPFETIITDRDGRTKYTNTELHTAALKAARAEQKRIADEFKRIVEKPEGLIEYCAKESGYPVGSKKLMDYVNRHYGHN